MDARLGFVALAVVVTATACGGSSNGADATVTPRSSALAATTIGVADGHLVDPSGMTLYLFEADKSTTSTCSAACAAAWPPVTTQGDPEADGAAKADALGTTRRSDGATQVTYAGHPLYRFSGDTAPGDMNGAGSEAFGAEWYPVTPAGEALETGKSGDDMAPSPSTSGDSSYSYSY
jgi:predicted lipoprotein with Yx(FWY)xxD motif